MKPSLNKSKFDSLFPVTIQPKTDLDAPHDSPPRGMSAMAEVSTAASAIGGTVIILMALNVGPEQEQPASAELAEKAKVGNTSSAVKKKGTTVGDQAPPIQTNLPPNHSMSERPESKASPSLDVTEFISATETAKCNARTREVAKYLQRGEVTLTSSNGMVAAAWLAKLSPNRPEAQVAFAAFSIDGRNTASPRSVGTSFEIAPQMFANKSNPTIVFFDDQGLAFTTSHWEAAPPGKIEHIRAIGVEDADYLALAATPSGSIVGATTLAWDRSQLGLFSFNSGNGETPTVKALGVTRHAKKPRWPAIAADSHGYTLVWHEERGHIVASRFDLRGNEENAGQTVVTSGAVSGRVHLLATTKGVIAVWTEGERIMARLLDARGRPQFETRVVAQGKNVALASHDEGALVVFIGSDGPRNNQLLAIRLGEDAAPAPKGIRIGNGLAVDDTPAATRMRSKVAFFWAEPMDNGLTSKCALLRTIDAACIP